LKKFLILLITINSVHSASAQAYNPEGGLILTMGGDLNLSQSNKTPEEDGTCKRGQCFTWEELFSGLKPVLNGELNFFNMESVVTDGRESLSPHGGKFRFRSHLEGLRYAKSIGLNWFSLANNHIGDYGEAGLYETLESVEQLSREGLPVLYHGVARKRHDVLTPAVLEFNSENEGRVRIAFAAVTFVRNTPVQISDHHPGVIYPENSADMNILLANFRAMNVDFKVLSIHGGTEKKTSLDSWQQSRYRKFLDDGDLDLIIGHHPHRIRPVERYGHRMIFYSLGNYLMLGAESLNDLGSQQDYALLGRLYLKRTPQGRMEIQRAEAVPLFNMHARVYPLVAEDARRRIENLNALTKNQLGSAGVFWKPLPNGWGSSCFVNCQSDPLYQDQLQ
jgi:poly-gamma-glutamate synthesis protein (capsule biosynthesis protein)